MKTQEELDAMKAGEYQDWCISEPRPKDLAGFQQIANGLIKRGDLLVKYGQIVAWVDVSVGRSIDSVKSLYGDCSIYRRMPVDSHESIYQKSVEASAPVYRELEEGEIIQAGDEFSFGGKWITWNLSDTAVGLEYNELEFCRNTRTTRPKPQATKPLDPKGDAGKLKPQLQLIPPVLSQETAKALSHGAGKYGPWNWRENKVEIMTYIGAMKRHLDCILEGEDIDPESRAHHLGHVAASCGIVLDAQKHGTLVDNRPNVKAEPRGQNNSQL